MAPVPSATGRAQPERLFFIALMAAVLTGMMVTWGRFGYCIAAGHCVFADDFQVFYTAARRAVAGQFSLIYDVQGTHAWLAQLPGLTQYRPFLNPPISLFFLYPLGFFSFWQAFVFWYALQAALLAASLNTAYMRQLLAPPAGGSSTLYTACLFLPFVVLSLFAGQIGMLCAALFILVLSWRKSRPQLAGLALMVFSFKPQLTLALVFLLVMEKNVKTLGWAVVFTLLMAGLSALCFGVQLWSNYPQMMRLYGQLALQAPEQYRIISASIYMGLRLAGIPASAAGIMQLLTTAAVFALLWRPFRRVNEEPQKILLLCLATFLVSPYVSYYDTVILGLASALLHARSALTRHAGIGRIALSVLLFLPIIALQLQFDHIPYCAGAIAAVFAAVRLRPPLEN